MKHVPKVSRLKLYLPRYKRRFKEALIFFILVSFVFNTLIPVRFPFVKAHLKNLF